MNFLISPQSEKLRPSHNREIEERQEHILIKSLYHDALLSFMSFYRKPAAFSTSSVLGKPS